MTATATAADTITATLSREIAADSVVTVTKAGTKAYIYYDVLNQYGESLRSSTTINWTTSAGTPLVDRATGKLTVTNGDGTNPFTYGSEIYVTGVYTKTGVVDNHAAKTGLCVLDQYGQEMTLNTQYALAYGVSDAKENVGAFAHVLNNLSIRQNGSEDANIYGAELGDTFKLTATVRDLTTSNVVTAEANITMGADTKANIKSGQANDGTDDYTLRYTCLGYDR